MSYEVATYECGPLHVITVTGPGLKAGASALTAGQARMALCEALSPEAWTVDCMYVEQDTWTSIEYSDESIEIRVESDTYNDARNQLYTAARMARVAI